MRLTFAGGAGTVTGSCHHVEAEGCDFLVDCGMFQGGAETEALNREPFPFDPEALDFVLLTHAHIDHSGLIPRLFRDGFRGRIYASGPTIDLCRIMLLDSAHIQELEAGWQARKAIRAGEAPFEPLYTADDATKCLSHFEALPFGQVAQIAPEVGVRFRRAGHILGSAIVEVQLGSGSSGPKIVFSGDLGNVNQPIIKDPEFVSEASHLIIESTYGNRVHEDRMTSTDKLKRIIHHAFERGGNVIIPAFAVARTQDVVYDIGVALRKGEIPAVDVFIDSPMAVSATEVFDRSRGEFDLETTDLIDAGEDPFDFPGIHYVRTVEESKALNSVKRGAIIISASGMCNFGRIKHHLKHNLWRPECTVLFVGFQARGTLGRRLQDGADTVKIFNEEVAVRATIESIDGYSAHADRDALLYWVRSLRNKPERVFVVHGEEESSTEFAAALGETLGIWAGVPRRGDSVDLMTGEGTVRPGLAEARGREPSIASSREELDRAYAALRKALEGPELGGDTGERRPSRDDISRLIAMMRDLARARTA